MIEQHLPTIVVVDEVIRERIRQDQLKAEGRFTHTCADLGHDLPRGLCILMEEVGEVSRELCEWMSGKQEMTPTYQRAREELIQCAAICVAMVEGIDHVMAGRVPAPSTDQWGPVSDMVYAEENP